MNIVEKLGLAVATDDTAEGYYVVTSWVHQSVGGIRSTLTFRKLTYTEAVDVMLALFDENRPGTNWSPEAVQGTLW